MGLKDDSWISLIVKIRSNRRKDCRGKMKESVKNAVCVTLPLASTNGIAPVWVWHG